MFNWKLKFEDRPGPDWVDCSVTGGNLVAVDGAGQPMNPIHPSTYVTVTVVKAVSAAIVADVAEWTQAEKDVVLVATPAIKNKTDSLPTDQTSKLDLETAHGLGSWEGATPLQVWNHDDRRLTSRDIQSPVPGESLPSEEEVQDVQTVLAAIKGLGFESAEDALRVIRQLVEVGAPPPSPKATFKI